MKDMKNQQLIVKTEDNLELDIQNFTSYSI